MKVERFASVWDAIEGDPAEAASLKARSELMIAIRQTIEGWNVEKAAAARRLGTTRKRLTDLFNGHIEEFSLDDLVRLAALAGLSVALEVVRPAA